MCAPQDDVLDCFGTPEQIGKIGRDIEENKCGWLVVQAIKLCNDEQVRELAAEAAAAAAAAVAPFLAGLVASDRWAAGALCCRWQGERRSP